MKKFLFFALIALCFVACSSDSEDPIVPQPQEETVNVVLTYTLTGENGGSMSRAANEFTPFYEKILNGEMMYDSYKLTFVNVETEFKLEINGKWSQKHMLTLPKGKYTVKGGSVEESYDKGCLISIDTVVEIKESGSLAIPADYNCFLIAVKKNDANSAEYRYLANNTSYKITSLSTFGDYYYLFMNADNIKDGRYILLSGPASQLLYLKNETFKNGKYYIFENIPGSYTIPEMESGM